MKTAMIWGAGGGIGRALVTQLTDEEWNVMAISHRSSNLEELTPHVGEADVASPYEVEAAIISASQMVDEIDLWIYAAGDITSTKVADLTPDEWQRITDANLTGAFLTTHYSLPLLASDAHLIYLGAISERLRLPGLAAYAAAKVGLEAFAEALGKEERKRRITVVRPGAVATPFWEKVPLRLPADALSPEAVAQQILEAHLQGQKGILNLTQVY
jgi:NAD(P)-dependent dehydrogenase (short-subunit alcohol dehydrogenase family)